MTAFFFVAGLVLLVAGADWLVKGASRIAAASGISSLVIGLTIVAYGTSAPEMAVSVKAAWAGQADLAIGNVVGSNIFNVLFILGLAAMVSPLVVAGQIIRVPVDDIRIAARGTPGVIVFNTAEDEKVVSVEHLTEEAEDNDSANGVAE